MFLVAVAVLACLRVLCIFWTSASILERMLLVCSSPDTTVQQPPYFQQSCQQTFARFHNVRRGSKIITYRWLQGSLLTTPPIGYYLCGQESQFHVYLPCLVGVLNKACSGTVNLCEGSLKALIFIVDTSTVKPQKKFVVLFCKTQILFLLTFQTRGKNTRRQLDRCSSTIYGDHISFFSTREQFLYR